MRLLAQVGYQWLLFSKDASYTAIIEALGTARVVQENGYGKDAMFTPVAEAEVAIKLLADGDVRLPDVATGENPYVERLLAETKRANDLQTQVYVLTAKVNKFEAAVKG